MLGDACVIIGASIQASSWSVAQIIVGRVLCVGDTKSIHIKY